VRMQRTSVLLEWVTELVNLKGLQPFALFALSIHHHTNIDTAAARRSTIKSGKVLLCL